MKKIISLFAVFFLLSCSDDSNTIFFELSQSSFELNKPQRTISVGIISNSSWVATDIPSWITLQQSNGTGNADLQIDISLNDDPDGQTRTGTVKFISDNKVYLLTIVQTAVNEIDISILNNVVHNLDYNQHVFTIQVSSTKPWQIFNKPDWVQISPSTGNPGITSVEIIILENVTSLARTGSIIFSTDPLNNNNNGTISNDALNIGQAFNTLMYAKTWNLTNPNVLTTGSDIRNSIELKNNKLNNTVFLTYNTILIGSKAYFESYDGVSWSYYNGNNFLYGSGLKLAVSNTGIPYTSYRIGSFNPCQGRATAIKVADISTPATSDCLSPSTVDYTDIAVINNNGMLLVYNDNSNNGKITVKQKTGSSWQVLGSEGFSVGEASYCNIAVNSNDEIYVAYSDAGVSNKIVVKKYNGSSWNSVGLIGFSSSGAENIEMEIGTNNDVFVAYKDLGNGGKITVKKYSSGSWQTIGTEGLSNYSVNSVSLALNNQNIPYIAYIENGNNPKIKKFDNNSSSWVDLNKIRIQDGGAFIETAGELKIIVGADNIPFIAMQSTISGFSRVLLAKYLGN